LATGLAEAATPADCGGPPGAPAPPRTCWKTSPPSTWPSMTRHDANWPASAS